MKIGETLNIFDVEVSLHHCCYCDHSFTVTPATTETKWGLGCLDWSCPSYAPSRDVDLFWDKVVCTPPPAAPAP